jgi:dipeptidase E
VGVIVAIGGGEISEFETLEIDREIVRLTGKSNPTALFIPTASGDPQGYIDTFHHIYGGLGCKTDVLLLIEDLLTEEQIKAKIHQSDLIYVGGGDTARMLEIWQAKKVDDYLREGYKNGIVLAGLSAGSICWFDYGHSDSYTYRTGVQQDYFKIKGLGLIAGIHCPHYTEEGREDDFDRMVADSDDIGIALDDNCAIEVNGDQFRILKSQTSAKAYKIFMNGKKIVKAELNNSDSYNPISHLYAKM